MSEIMRPDLQEFRDSMVRKILRDKEFEQLAPGVEPHFARLVPLQMREESYSIEDIAFVTGSAYALVNIAERGLSEEEMNDFRTELGLDDE